MVPLNFYLNNWHQCSRSKEGPDLRHSILGSLWSMGLWDWSPNCCSSPRVTHMKSLSLPLTRAYFFHLCTNAPGARNLPGGTAAQNLWTSSCSLLLCLLKGTKPPLAWHRRRLFVSNIWIYWGLSLPLVGETTHRWQSDINVHHAHVAENELCVYVGWAGGGGWGV